MSDLVSVIVPVYKVEKYLDRCVESILKQSYKNIEVILVDDGSPDNCPQMCDEWAKKDSRILVIHKANGGLSDARNVGIDISKGKYICFVDSDDYVASRFIEVLYGMIKKYEAEISAVDAKWVYDEKTFDEENSNDVEIFDNKEGINNLLLNLKYKDYAWNKMYESRLFKTIRYPVGKNMEDLATTYKLIYESEKIVYNPSKLYFYYQRNDSILHTIDSEFCSTKLQITRERYSFVKEKFPKMLSNDIYMFCECLGEYPYLSAKQQLQVERDMKLLWKKVRKDINLKTKVKYFMFLYARRVYLKRFTKC